MEGAFATLLVYVFTMLIAIILLESSSRGALIASGVLFVTAVIVNQLPIIPHMPGTLGDGTFYGLSLIFVGLMCGGIFLFFMLAMIHMIHRVTDEQVVRTYTIWLGTACAILMIGVIGRDVFHYPLYNDSPKGGSIFEYASEWTMEPTGAETVLYENDKDIALEKETDAGWKNVSTIATADELITNQSFRVAKNGETIDVPSVADIEYVDVNCVKLPDAYYTIAKVRVVKVTLIERVHKETLLVDSNRVLNQWTDNKIVVEYEITNMDEVKQHMSEDERQEQTKTQTKEELQQFVTPTKGE
mgnify:FL=1